MIKLNLGCGHRYRDGYVNIDNFSQSTDIRVDIRADMRTVEYMPESVAEVYTRQTAMYFNPSELGRELRRWHTWLLPGGVLEMETSNLIFVCRAILEAFDQKNFSRLDGVFCVGQLFGVHESAGHRWSWCPETLGNLVRSVGFENIRTEPGSLEPERDFRLFATKPKK